MTAVEWFFRWFNDNPEATHKEYSEAFQQALEIEKQQSEKYAEFSIHCYKENMPILEFNDFIKLLSDNP